MNHNSKITEMIILESSNQQFHSLMEIGVWEKNNKFSDEVIRKKKIPQSSQKKGMEFFRNINFN